MNDIIEVLKTHGFRITNQRKIVLQVLLSEECTSCKDIYYKAHSIDSSIGMATVYRMINALEEIGIFNREKLFQIAHPDDEIREKEYVIEFDDHTTCEIKESQWKKIISDGLKNMGYDTSKKIDRIIVKTPQKK